MFFYFLIIRFLLYVIRFFCSRPLTRINKMKIPIQFKLSLKDKALIGIIAILIPILITFILVYSKNRIYLKNRALDTLTVIAEAYEGQVYQFLEKTKIRAQDFASDGFIRTQLQKAVHGNTSAINKLNKHLIKNKIVLDKTINTISILFGRTGGSLHKRRRDWKGFVQRGMF